MLRGITWNHTRGLLPMVATAQLFSERNPGVEVVWEKRSLQEFADASIERLAERFDLLVIDHPWAGHASRRGILLPLDAKLPAGFLDDQRLSQVGRSHDSYTFDGWQMALAIDAATPVASWRIGSLTAPPRTWEEVIELARAGQVAIPGLPIDLLMNFYMVCGAVGEFPFERPGSVIPRDIGRQALERMRELAALCDPGIYAMNPIAVYRHLSDAAGPACYCPFAYGYSNYARAGYAPHRLAFGDLVTLNGRRLASTLGGTGLAIAASSRQQDWAVRYAQFVAEPEIQRTVYTAAGGQPGHRSAWLDAGNNAASGDYFSATLPALDRAFLRPRYHGHMHFQDHAGDPLRDFLRDGGDPEAVLKRFDQLYAESLAGPRL